MNRLLSAQVTHGLAVKAHIKLGLLAAQMAFVFWRRAFPEKEHQAPFIHALDVVDAFCSRGHLAPEAKLTAELAYQAVSACDLPPGDIQRSAGFSVAHVAMSPWLLNAGRASKAMHNAAVAINYSESIHRWAGHLTALQTALEQRAHDLLIRQADD